MSVNPLFSEALLQYIWQSALFSPHDLRTTAGEPLTILHPGTLQHDAGPDFTAARIRIGGMEWAGNVELHYRSSDWRRHGHGRDRRYDNVILHVVFEDDLPGSPIPCLELQHRIPKLMLRRYRLMMENAAFVPCAPMLGNVPVEVWVPWKRRLMEERWERKTAILRAWLVQNRFNWEEVCYRALAQGFGMPVNTQAFELLVESMPFMVVARQRLDLERLEALLFGQAGMLDGDFRDDYPLRLQQEYRFLRHKYQIQPIPTHTWRWLRMRPSAFPEGSLARFAAMLHATPHLFSRLMECNDLAELEDIFLVQPSFYWQAHYRFELPAGRPGGIGKETVHRLIINTVAPLLYLYGNYMQLPEYTERAVRFLCLLPPENNRITRGWKELGVDMQNAFDSQAVLQLKQYYCEQKRCLQCGVGCALLGQLKILP